MTIAASSRNAWRLATTLWSPYPVPGTKTTLKAWLGSLCHTRPANTVVPTTGAVTVLAVKVGWQARMTMVIAARTARTRLWTRNRSITERWMGGVMLFHLVAGSHPLDWQV